MTLTEYAKRIRVSTMAVSKAIACGRLAGSVARDQHGRPLISDPELADREWEAARRAPRLAQRRSAHGMSTPSPDERAENLARALDDIGDRDLKPGGVPTLATSVAIREAAAARKELARAELAEIEVAKRRGQTIPTEQAWRDVHDQYTLVKTRLLGVPSLLVQRCPQHADAVPVLDELIRAALEELVERLR